MLLSIIAPVISELSAVLAEATVNEGLAPTAVPISADNASSSVCKRYSSAALCMTADCSWDSLCDPLVLLVLLQFVRKTTIAISRVLRKKVVFFILFVLGVILSVKFKLITRV